MKTRMLITIIVLAIMLFITFNAYAQTEWEIDWIQTINITPDVYEKTKIKTFSNLQINKLLGTKQTKVKNR